MGGPNGPPPPRVFRAPKSPVGIGLIVHPSEAVADLEVVNIIKIVKISTEIGISFTKIGEIGIVRRCYKIS